jgi:hypothetical protein
MGGFGAAQDHRAFVVGSAGLFYLVASNIRRNRTFTLMAAILFNLAVWFLYSFFQLRFQDLPQLLAVPVGLSIVLAAQVNSDRLSPRVLRNLRYLGLLVIYLSSAYKMFLTRDLIHAIILTVLSVLGGVLGMALRIRAFVYLGVTFLVFTVVGRVLQITEGGKIAWGIFTVTLGLALLLLITLMERHDRRRAEQESPSNDATRPPSSTHQ